MTHNLRWRSLKLFCVLAMITPNMDVLAQGAGEAKYIVVSNKADNSVSIINATDN